MKSIISNVFSTLPGAQFKYYIPMLILVFALIIGGVVFSIIYKKKKKEDFAFKRLFAKTSKRLILFGILFLVLTMVRYENIPYFSMRLWLYSSILLFVYFAYKTITVYYKDYPREKSNVHNNMAIHKKKVVKNNYLPNKKQR